MLQTLTYKVNVAPDGVPPMVRLSLVIMFCLLWKNVLRRFTHMARSPQPNVRNC